MHGHKKFLMGYLDTYGFVGPILFNSDFGWGIQDSWFCWFLHAYRKTLPAMGVLFIHYTVKELFMTFTLAYLLLLNKSDFSNKCQMAANIIR